MNTKHNAIALTACGFLHVLPAQAHGTGIALALGVNLLFILFCIYWIWAVYKTPKGKRFSCFWKSIGVFILWLAVFIGPWFSHNFWFALKDYEEEWALTLPFVLLVTTILWRKRKA